MFDLDDTLAESFKPPAPGIIDELRRILEIFPVAIITAAGFPRIEHQFLEKLIDSPFIERLYIFPNSSAECFTFTDGEWRRQYNLNLTHDERDKISSAIMECLEETKMLGLDPIHEPKIVDREAQVAFAALGLGATAQEKETWDPDQKKRRAFKEALEKRIPEFEILIGGYTTIDITRKGVDKAHGVRWFSEHAEVPLSEILYVGDAFYPGGNDFVVVPTGVQTRPTSGPSETRIIMHELVATCGL